MTNIYTVNYLFCVSTLWTDWVSSSFSSVIRNSASTILIFFKFFPTLSGAFSLCTNEKKINNVLGIWVLPVLPLTCCVILGTLFVLSGPQFSL